MSDKTAAICQILFGLVLLGIGVYTFRHHEYMFYDDSWEPGWFPNIFFWLGGVWFAVYGAIGYWRAKSKAEQEHNP